MYTILLIEGDLDARSRARRAFSTSAPHVRLCIADGGAEGLAYLSGVGPYADRAAYPVPQLVLLDLDLPGRAAFDVLRWSKAKPSFARIPMIVRTSRTGSLEVNEAYALGAAACLSKNAEPAVPGYASAPQCDEASSQGRAKLAGAGGSRVLGNFFT